MLAGVSALLLPYQDWGSSERLINWINIIIGLLMIAAALIYLMRTNRNSTKKTPDKTTKL